MTKMLRSALILTACVALPGVAMPQTEAPPLKPEPGLTVYLKAPLSALEITRSKWNGKASFKADITLVDGKAAINGKADWEFATFPGLGQFTVKKVKRNEIQFEDTDGLFPLKLTFPEENAAALFPMLFVTEPDRDAYKTSVYRVLAGRFFDGTPLAELDESHRLTLIEFAHATAHGTTMGSATYKDNTYLLVDLGQDDSVYNEIRMNQAQRVARVMNDRLLTTLKGFARPVKDVPAVYGLKLVFEIPHKNFMREYAIPEYDKLELYAPAVEITKFSDADTTSQQFVDACVIIVNGNRISVPLAGE